MLGEICDRLEGADVSVVAEAVGRDTRVGKKYLKPAVGYGGPCFPRDTVAFGRVAHRVGGTADLAIATDTINRRQVARVATRFAMLLRPGGVVCILGLSYKPNTPVLEESQGIMLVKSLSEAGIDVVTHDPMAAGPARSILANTARIAATAREAVSQANVVVIMTPWPEYGSISPDWIEHERHCSLSLTAGVSSIRPASPIGAGSSDWDIRRRSRPRWRGWLRSEDGVGQPPKPR